MKKIFAFILALSSILPVRSQIIEGDSLIWENSDKSWVQIMDDLIEAFNDSNLLTYSFLAEKSLIV